MKKLAIITTHPIQYHAPLFALLSKRQKVTVKIFYTWSQVENKVKYDPGFDRSVDWDIPMLEGYEYTFVKNIAKEPGSHHFKGINNPALIKAIDEWEADAILVFGWKFKSHLKVLRYFKGKKTLLFRGDSTLLDDAGVFSFKKKIRRILLKWVYTHVDFALYTGKANRSYFQAAGLKEHQLIFAPHSVDNDRFEKGTDNLRDKLNIPRDATVFLFCGKLEDKKNPVVLLRSLIDLNNVAYHLIFVGEGKLEKELKETVKTLRRDIQDTIHFVGFQNQSVMPSVYSSADVFVLPSKGPGETWGLSVNEAMASGLPIIVSNMCGSSIDLVKSGINGFVFKSESQFELTACMQKIVADKDGIKKMGDASKWLIEKWSFESICIAIENILNFFINSNKV